MILVPDEIKKEFLVMFQAATEASFVCKKLGEHLSTLDVMTKSDESPVTLADISAQIVVNYRLEREFPGVVIIGEEDSTEISASMLEKIRGIFSHFPLLNDINLKSTESVESFLRSNEYSEGTKNFWTVDPIDGTKGFIRGDQYCVCIALIDSNTQKPIMSALGCPNMTKDSGEMEKGVLMISLASIGNFICKLGEDWTALKAVGTSPLHSNLSDAIFTCAFVSNHTNPLEIDGIKEYFRNETIPIRMDSQCKYGVLALGRAHVYYRRHAPKDPKARRDWQCDYTEAIWDNAPGYLFVKEAGGQVTDFDGNDLVFPPTKHFVIKGGILASMLTPELHQKVISVVKERNPVL